MGSTPLYTLAMWVFAAPKGVVVAAILVKNKVSIWPFCCQIGYGFCTLVLNWVCFLRESCFNN